MEKLELRMYGLVPYNISPIQQGIQFGHAVVEYGCMISNLVYHATKENDSYGKSVIAKYHDWAEEWKTFIILNGGTTNSKFKLDDGLPFGTLNQHVLTLRQLGVELAVFNEPDLGDQLTAVVFIVDERVFNDKKYPVPADYETDADVRKEFNKQVGGSRNLKLREFLKQFRLA